MSVYQPSRKCTMKKKQDFILFFRLPFCAQCWLKCKHARRPRHGINPKYQAKQKVRIYPPHFRLMDCKNAKTQWNEMWNSFCLHTCVCARVNSLVPFQHCTAITRQLFFVQFHFLLTFHFWLSHKRKWKRVQLKLQNPYGTYRYKFILFVHLK